MQALGIAMILFFGLHNALAFAGQPLLVLKADFQAENWSQKFHYLEDKEGRLDWQDYAGDDYAESFQSLAQPIANFGVNDSAWWGRLDIRNDTGAPKTLIFTQSIPTIDTLELFLIDEKGRLLKRELKGDTVKPVLKQPRERLPTYTFDFPPGDSRILLKMKSKGILLLNLKAQNPELYNRDQLFEYCFLFSNLAILLAMIFYKLLGGILLKQKDFILYALFLVTIVVQTSAFTGIIHVLLDDSEWLSNHGFLISGALSSIFVCLFSMRFLAFKKQHRYPIYASWFLICISFFAIALAFYNYNLAARLGQTSAILASLVVIYLGILKSLEGSRMAVYFTLGWITPSVMNLARILMIQGFLPANFWIEAGLLPALVIQSILHALALGEKVRLSDSISRRKVESLHKALSLEHQKVLQLAGEVAHLLNNPLNYIELAFSQMKSKNELIKNTIEALLGEESNGDEEAAETRKHFRGLFHSLIDPIREAETGLRQAKETITELRALSGVDGFSLESLPIAHILEACESKLQLRLGLERCLNLRITDDTDLTLKISGNRHLSKQVLTLFLTRMIEHSTEDVYFTCRLGTQKEELIFEVWGATGLSFEKPHEIQLELDHIVRGSPIKAEISLNQGKFLLTHLIQMEPDAIEVKKVA